MWRISLLYNSNFNGDKLQKLAKERTPPPDLKKQNKTTDIQAT